MTNDASPQTTLSEQDGTGTIRVEDVFATDVQDLWSAITDPDRLSRWVAVVEGELRVGGVFRAKFTSGWDGEGRVEECVPPHHLRLAMAPGTAEATFIEASLVADSGGTRLIVIERGLPLGELPLHGAGWQVHIEDLGSHLSGQPAQDWEPRWRQRLPVFERRFTHLRTHQ